MNGISEIELYNESSHNGYFLPTVDISISSGTSFEIINLSDSERSMIFSGLPTALKELHIDNDYGVITSGESGLHVSSLSI